MSFEPPHFQNATSPLESLKHASAKTRMIRLFGKREEPTLVAHPLPINKAVDARRR
jgi:hypothetical protein